MAREIKPTPVLEGQDVIEFYKKMANFKQSLTEKGTHSNRHLHNRKV